MSLMQFVKTAATEPATPRRCTPQHEASLSPPPAPRPKRRNLGQALKEDDLVEVVEILAKQPDIATVRFLDTAELPLERATRLRCDPTIIMLLKDHCTD